MKKTRSKKSRDTVPLRRQKDTAEAEKETEMEHAEKQDVQHKCAKYSSRVDFKSDNSACNKKHDILQREIH